MNDTGSQDVITERLVDFMRERFIPEELKDDFGQDTELLQMGVLDSLNAAVLLNYIRNSIGAPVPPSMIDTENFRDARRISEAICELRQQETHP